MSSEGFNVGFIHLEHHRSHDQIDREYQAKAFFTADHDSFRIDEGPALYANFLALAQVGMRPRLQTCGQARLQCANLEVRHRGGLALKGYKLHDPGSPKNAQSVSKIEVHEDVAREQRQIQFLASILPSTHAAVYRKKEVQSPMFEMTTDHLFVPRTNRNSIPVLDRQRLFGGDQSFAGNSAA